jgi:hypothetical protein
MDKRKFSRWLQRSNVDDLLDDGIENNSDVKFRERSKDAEAGDSREDIHVDSIAEPAAPQSGREEEPSATRREDRISLPGLLLGVFFMLLGIAAFLFPKDLYIFHQRIKYARSFVEYITASQSQVYAVGAFILGIAICGFSLYRPR